MDHRAWKWRESETCEHRQTRRGFLGALPRIGFMGSAVWASTSAHGEEIEIPPREGQARVLIDTDAANYFDDQFALAYALMSGEDILVEAIYAAPFSNRRIDDPRTGMELSYQEIGRVLETLRTGRETPVLKGSPGWMADQATPVESPSAEDMIERIMRGRPEIDYIVAIGAATTVASALLMEPRIGQRSTVIWLGGTPHHFPSASEFNLRQDPAAARVLFDSGARLMHVPAPGLAENLRASRDELEQRMRGNSAIGSYLLDTVSKAAPEDPGPNELSRTLALWDMATIAWLVNPRWVESVLVPSPLLGPDLTWFHNPHRHRVRVATRLLRDQVFTDFYRKIAAAPA